MKKEHLIILYEYSSARDDGSRKILQNDIIGRFSTPGVAHLCYEALTKSYAYLLNYNAENEPNKHKYALALQITR